jgi:RNA polymerase sigma factor (sigma-70 family)
MASGHEKHREERDLVLKCVEGDRFAWETLFAGVDRGLELSIRHTLHVHGVAATDDRVQDLKGDLVVALVRDDFRKLRSFSGHCKLSSWLKVVAANHVVDSLRRRRMTVSLSDDTRLSRHLVETLADSGPSPHEELIEHRQEGFIKRVQERLTAQEQRFFSLFVTEGRSFDEIAAILDTTLGAVYARKNRLRKRLMVLADKELGTERD